MKAVVYYKYGPPEVLKLEEVEKPVPRDNEVLVKVHASSVSSGVIFIRKGTHPDSNLFTFILRLIYGMRKPKRSILGYEVAGEIESVGQDVKRFKKGNLVFGTTTRLDHGAYAEYVCLPEKWKQGVISLKPSNLSFEQAAALPIGGMAAMYILQKASVQKDQKVLIYGASGSVGTSAVQLAVNYGAKVTGVCSSSNLELVKSLGASHVIDYTQEDFTQNAQKYDVIFDCVAKISKSQCKNSLRKDGKYLTVKSPTKELTENLLRLKELAEEGKLIPVIDKIYTLEHTAEAHAYADLGHKKGNVVIKIR